MALTVNETIAQIVTTSASSSSAVTLDAGTTYIAVSVAVEDASVGSTYLSALTFDGQALTDQTTSFVTDGFTSHEWWTLDAPTTGSSVNLAWTFGDAPTRASFRIVGLTGSPTFNSADTDSGSSATAYTSLTASGATGGIGLAGNCLRNTHSAAAPGAGETELWDDSASDASHFGNSKAGAATVTFNTTWTTARAYTASMITLDEAATAPTAPTGLSVTRTTGAETSSLDLSWTDASSDELGFRIYRLADATETEYTLMATTNAGQTAWTDASCEELTSYTYRVTAFNAAGESGWTSGSQLTAVTPPVASQTYTTYAPTVVQGDIVINAAAPPSMTYTTYAPTINTIEAQWIDINDHVSVTWTEDADGTVVVWTQITRS